MTVESDASARLDSLWKEDGELPRLPLERSWPFGTWAVAVAFLGVAPLALLTRLLSMPFRRTIRARLEAARRADRARAAALLESELAAVEAQGETGEAPFYRGVALLKGRRWLEAEEELDAYIGMLEAVEPTNKVMLARALHDRSIARDRLGLRRLAARDSDRVKQLDMSLAVATRPPWTYHFVVLFKVLRELAGLATE
jgi:hypothetical protein